MDARHINALKQAQNEFAIEALRRPAEKTEFGHGYAVGVVAGYEMAMDLLINMEKKEEKDGQDL